MAPLTTRICTTSSAKCRNVTCHVYGIWTTPIWNFLASEWSMPVPIIIRILAHCTFLVGAAVVIGITPQYIPSLAKFRCRDRIRVIGGVCGGVRRRSRGRSWWSGSTSGSVCRGRSWWSWSTGGSKSWSSRVKNSDTINRVIKFALIVGSLAMALWCSIKQNVWIQGKSGKERAQTNSFECGPWHLKSRP